MEPTDDDSCRASATDSCRASASGSQGGARIGINVKAGAALSMFDPLSWVYSFVEFFYGDCLPGDPRRDDAARLSFEEVFECLKRREGLQYSLPTDAQPYKAGPMSRWDSAPMSLLFGSTLRSLRMLRASKLSILRTQNAWETFKQDFQAIAECTAEEFQRAFKYETHGGAKTPVEVFSAPGAKEKHPKVHTALKHVLCQTGTVPPTEGYTMNVRHQSFSQTLCFGALKLFLTTNFADTYCPLVLKLYDVDDSGEAIELVGEVTVNLFEDAPTMPTQQRMHKIVAQHPSVQARLFLLMEQVTITELLCVDRAFIGNKDLDCLDPGQSYWEHEDSYASNGSPGLANFLTCMTEPLASQGRGFTHGHKKANEVPSCRAGVLKQMFRASDPELQSIVQRMRDAVLSSSIDDPMRGGRSSGATARRAGPAGAVFRQAALAIQILTEA